MNRHQNMSMDYLGKIRPRLTRTFVIIGSLYSAAAFLCGLPFCWELIGQWMPVVAFVGISSTLTLVSTRRPRHPGSYCAILVFVALAIRLAWALHTAFPPPGDDYEHYRSVSLDLLQGKWDELHYTYWPWGYFLYLYSLALLFGSALVVPVTANAIIGSATTLLVYAIARRIFEERIARIAAAIYAFWPGVIYWTSVLCTEIPHLFLFLAALLFLLMGMETSARRGAYLAAGGVLAALAEFFRALSPLLLLPFVFYAFARKTEAEKSASLTPTRRWRRDAAVALGTYILCLGLLLTAESIAVGYPNFSTSHTMGVNLAFGLNWESRGMFNPEDAKLMDSDDPREVNRRGIKLGLRRLRAMLGSDWWKLPVLAALKFKENWSHESAGYDATYAALPDDLKTGHWMTLYSDDLSALGQFLHTIVLALAAVGFWRNRGSTGLAFLGAMLLVSSLLHIFIEADCRYHFWVQPLLGIAGAGAFTNLRNDRHSQVRLE